VAGDGKPVLDPSGKSNGRGVYLCPDSACFDFAKKKKSISRGLGIEGITESDYEVLRSAFELYANLREDSL
ncbi:MAG: YlxR family protein, partial [Clostridiales Family XIII bacterium]|nr:YlxR family protein [Clostridiales Family XIII bacterium]